MSQRRYLNRSYYEPTASKHWRKVVIQIALNLTRPTPPCYNSTSCMQTQYQKYQQIEINLTLCTRWINSVTWPIHVGRNVQWYHQTVNRLLLLPCSPSVYIHVVLYFSLCVCLYKHVFISFFIHWYYSFTVWTVMHVRLLFAFCNK